MTLSTLQRLMWRIRKANPGNKRPSYSELEKAVIYECGVNRATYNTNRRALLKIGWIRPHNQTRFEITEKDLSDS